MINRRGLVAGVLAGLVAPAIIRTPGLLMPIRVAARPEMPTFDAYMEMYFGRITEELAAELAKDFAIYGCYATRTIPGEPFIERIDPMAIFKPDVPNIRTMDITA